MAATTYGTGTAESQAQGAAVAASLPAIPSVEFPAANADELEPLYHFAARHTNVVEHVPCFCGCGRSSRHTSVSSCFVSERPSPSEVVWNDHGAQCKICLDVVRDAMTMWHQDFSIEEIRQAIIAKYHKERVPITPTPEPAAAVRALRRSHSGSH